MFFIKPKKIVLDCFTSRPEVYTYAPIQNSNKVFPDWWKQLPSKTMNMKYCWGFNQFFANGVTLNLWSDMSLISGVNNATNTEEIGWGFSDRTTNITQHDSSQMGSYLDDKKYRHLKIVTPWQFKCKEDINWVFIQNTWAFDEPDSIIIPPGILEFKYQSTVNINTLVNIDFYKNKQKKIFNFGTPLVNIIPMSDRKVEIKNHLVSEQEYANIARLSSISLSYHNKYKTTRDILEGKEKKCPFGFGGKN